LYAGVSKVPVQKFDLIIVDGADDSFAKIANLATTTRLFTLKATAHHKRKASSRFFRTLARQRHHTAAQSRICPRIVDPGNLHGWRPIDFYQSIVGQKTVLVCRKSENVCA
jgi:hypothetical protein